MLAPRFGSFAVTCWLLLYAPEALSLEVVAASGAKRAVLEQVAEAANCVLHLPSFRQAVASIEQFVDSEDDGGAVLRKLDQDRACPLGTYRRGGLLGSFMYWDRVDARYVQGASEIQFNLNRFGSASLPFLVGTAIHECSHLVGYRHRFNNVLRHPEIRASVPYVVGALAQAHAEQCLE